MPYSANTGRDLKGLREKMPSFVSHPTLNIVVPCYNEEEALPAAAAQLSDLIDRMAASNLVSDNSSIFFVDDGSRDRTWELICELNVLQPDRYHGLKLSRNCGHQNALIAGLRNAPGDVTVTIDADLQDDIEVIQSMIVMFREGFEIVYGVRESRQVDTFFKRSTAGLYYALLKRLGVNIVVDHADFRLMSRRALAALERYNEINLFLRAIIPLIGFKSGNVTYERRARVAGESKYPLIKMLGLAINGITSFSMQPLRWITAVGMAIASISFIVGIWAMYSSFFSDTVVPGWTSIVVPSSFLGGLQLLSVGIIGEYIGKIFMEVKKRPLFEIEKIV